MKTFGWICVVLGGLSFIGAASAGHNVFGPVFWLALGIALVYLGNQKEEEKKKNEVASTSKPKLTPIIENKPVQVAEPIRQKTYWENYKDTNPSKAKEIEELLRIDIQSYQTETQERKFKCWIDSARAWAVPSLRQRLLILKKWNNTQQDSFRK